MNGLRVLDVVLAGVPVGRSIDPRRYIVAGVSTQDQVRKRYGRLTGAFARGFREWLG